MGFQIDLNKLAEGNKRIPIGEFGYSVDEDPAHISEAGSGITGFTGKCQGF
jgi:hypothetical protein